MPGITFLVDFDKAEQNKLHEKLLKLKKLYLVPTVMYTEKHIVENSFLVYSCLPEFIKDSKILSFNNFIIAFDGDFYNEQELMNHIKKTNLSKLEIIYHLFLQEGEKFGRLINGEFNILIFDKEKKELLVTNDRFARRPLFYKRISNRIIFSSEKKGIISLLNEPSDIDPQGLLELFVFRHNLRNRTFIKDIFHLQAASVLRISRESFQSTNYFTWDFSDRSANFDRVSRVKEIAEAISKALEIRIMNKKRIILWLSGGFDSRTMACFIREKYKRNVLTETFGEEGSDELEIAKKIADKLGYRWRAQKVNLSYSELAKISTWRTEFAVPAVDHPFIGNQVSMKKDADYIIQGVPGIFEINSGHLSLGKILASVGIKPYDNFFGRYAKEKKEISFIFNRDYFNEYYDTIKRDFIEFFNQTNQKIDLYKWDVFNLSQRQPNYSHMADLVESDLFEMLHPMTDINLTPLFTQIPLKDKLFLQVTKALLYEYVPEIREIPIGNGRGRIKKNNTLLRNALQDIKSNLYKSSKSIVWDKKRAMELDYHNIKNTIKEMLLSTKNLRDFFDFNNINILINDKNLLLQNQMLVDILLTFVYANSYFITNRAYFSISEIIKNYDMSEF